MSYTGNIHDFDFLAGTWSVLNRRLRQRNVGCHDWDEFMGISTCRVSLGGVVNVDEIHFPDRGFTGFTLRALDLANGQWSIYWVNSTIGRVEPPVLGGFDGDHGLFVGDDDDQGHPVRAKFDWTRQGPTSARWEQSFSYDDERTWETNWTMEFTRSMSDSRD